MSDDYGCQIHARVSGAHLEMLKELQTKLSASQSTVVRFAIEDYYERNKDAKPSDKAISLNNTIAENLTGQLLGLFKKEKDKIESIQNQVNEGNISEERGKKLISETKYRYKESREALTRQYDSLMQAKESKTTSNSTLAQIINKKMLEGKMAKTGITTNQKIDKENNTQPSIPTKEEMISKGICEGNCPPGSEETCQYCSTYLNNKYAEESKKLGMA